MFISPVEDIGDEDKEFGGTSEMEYSWGQGI